MRYACNATATVASAAKAQISPRFDFGASGAATAGMDGDGETAARVRVSWVGVAYMPEVDGKLPVGSDAPAPPPGSTAASRSRMKSRQVGYRSSLFFARARRSTMVAAG